MKAASRAVVTMFVLGALLVLPRLQPLEAQQGSGSTAPKAPEALKLKVGDTAPDFTLLMSDGQGVKPVSLHDFKGKKNVALAFYVFAFTGG